MRNILEERGHEVVQWDPCVDGKLTTSLEDNRPVLYFIGTKHLDFLQYPFVPGSIVLDPWRYIPDKPDISVLRIGDKSSCVNEQMSPQEHESLV